MVDVVVVGGGVIGLTTAVELASAKLRVSVLDTRDFDHGTSHGNAGLLCPSYVTPIASPRVLLTALGWLIRGDGPFALARPPWKADMAGWLARFVVACASEGEIATGFLAGLARRSIEWYDDFARNSPEFGLRRSGWLYVYKTRRGLNEGIRHARAVGKANVSSQILSAREAIDREPGLRDPVGAIYYPGDAHLDPHSFVLAAGRRARQLGVEMVGNSRVLCIRPSADQVSVVTENGEVTASQVILASGASTPTLVRNLGTKVPVLPARGHSASLFSDYIPRMPLLLAEAHLVVTPMAKHLRMTGGLELGSFDAAPHPTKLDAMARHAGEYLSGGAPSYYDGWVGFRPLTPSGLPIVGHLTRHRRVIVACGHGTLGMTLAPATAQVVRSIVHGEPPPFLLSPKRVGC